MSLGLLERACFFCIYPHTTFMMTRKKYDLHPFLKEEKAKPLHTCMYKGCEKDGLYPAPKSRQQLREYLWFCLEHIQSYNKNWNYYAGMNPAAIEQSRKADETWERPSWTYSSPNKQPFESFRYKDPLGIFGDTQQQDQKNKTPTLPISRFDEKNALETMQLIPPYTAEQLRLQYKLLAKAYHPDLNKGSKEAEERFKQVNLAYALLKKNFEHV